MSGTNDKNASYDEQEAQNFVNEIVNEKNEINLDNVQAFANSDEAVNDMPPKLQNLVSQFKNPKSKARIVEALVDSIASYKKEHGSAPKGDQMNYILHMAESNSPDFLSQNEDRRIALDTASLDGVSADSASSGSYDVESLRSQHIETAIYGAVSEMCPFAHYLAANVKTNEAKFVIVGSEASGDFGGYKDGETLDGVNSGKALISSRRYHRLTVAGDNLSAGGKITAIQKTAFTCDQDGEIISLSRGRTTVYVNGVPAGGEIPSAVGTGASAIAGSATVGSTTHTIGGTVNTTTAVVALEFTPALPAGTIVSVKALLDFEKNPTKAAKISNTATKFSVFAEPARASVSNTPEFRSQMKGELNINPAGVANLAMLGQYSNERHYNALYSAIELSENATFVFDMDYSSDSDKTRGEMLSDFSIKVEEASQYMAETNLSHGVTHMYVEKKMRSFLLGLPIDQFKPSGISARPSIYRIGTYRNGIEVYYTPRGLNSTSNSADLLLVGRGSSLARSPIVMGDAVSPILEPLSNTTSQESGSTFFSRSFNEPNPHTPSALSCVKITITNME